MPIDSHHSEYDAAAAKWRRCRDAVEGQCAVHAAGEAYLPKLKDQTREDYDAYKLRASYFNATGRTLEGLVGMVFRKAPAVEAPAAMQSVIDDIDLSGTSLVNLAQQTLSDVIEVGRIGVLVEYPVVIDQPRSAADASILNLRPYASVYKAESIINWRCARVNNVMQLVLVVLMESYEVSNDGYESSMAPQIRVLMLKDGVYIQQLWRKAENSGQWEQYGGDITPLMASKPIRTIPFFLFGPKSNDAEMQDPPILDLADLNLAHYRVTADYEHGCHFAGLPTAVVSGYQPAETGEKLYIGSATAWVFPDPNATATFLEFTGQGLGAIEGNLDRKEKQMAAIGARMLAPEKAGVEAEGTLAMRHNGEDSVLGSMANLVSDGWTRVLQFMAMWEGIAGDCSIKLNTDYMPKGMTAQELSELVKAFQSGAISFETFFENLQRGEIIRADKTADEEREQIAGDGEPLGGNNDDGQ
jgi:hypothetical protein